VMDHPWKVSVETDLRILPAHPPQVGWRERSVETELAAHLQLELRAEL
jgi:hypothetical protein